MMLLRREWNSLRSCPTEREGEPRENHKVSVNLDARQAPDAERRLRVRGIERVRLHADLTMLGRLSLALSRARAS